MSIPDDGIPAFLIISQEERKAAWDQFRAERKLVTAPEKTYKPITGAAPDDNA